MLAYFFDYQSDETEAEMTFEGFKKSATNPDLLAELDAFGQ